MSQPVMLWNNQFAPLTWSIGFLNTDFNTAIDALVGWRKEHSAAVKLARSADGLPQALHLLEPLTFRTRLRELVCTTANPGWTAFFDCGIRGGDQMGPMRVLGDRLATRGVVVRWIPETASFGRPAGFGSRQLLLFGPEPFRRSIALVQDEGKWTFEQYENMQPFEDPGAYTRRPLKERLTPQMLIDYCAALGLAPFDDDFYPGPCALITKTPKAITPPVPQRPAPRALSLEEFKHWDGTTPPPAQS